MAPAPFNLPLYRTGDSHMDASEPVTSPIQLVSDVHAVVERMLEKVCKYHPNFHFFARDIRSALFKCLSTVSGPFPAHDTVVLEMLVSSAARQLCRSIECILDRFVSYIDPAEGQVAAEIADIADADHIQRRQQALSQGYANPFRHRLVNDIVTKETYSSKRVRPYVLSNLVSAFTWSRRVELVPISNDFIFCDMMQLELYVTLCR